MRVPYKFLFVFCKLWDTEISRCCML